MKKRVLSLLLALALAASLLVFPAGAAEIVDSGTCGENVTWTLDSDGLLTISGEGEMTDYDWGASPFYDREDIRSIVIGSGVTTIGANVFNDCGAVKSVVIPDSVVSIRDDAFYYCEGLREVTIPESVVSLGTDAFMGCKALTEVTIPAGVEQIGESVFLACTSLKEITVAAGNPAYQSIQGALLTGDGTELICCPAGKSGAYGIPEGVVRIRDYALTECKNLTDVTIPESVTEIGSTAFAYCEQLTTLRIPESVSYIGEQVFEGCRSLREIQVSENNPNYKAVDGVLMDRQGTTLLRCPSMKTGAYVIPEGVEVLASEAFEGCAGLTEVTIPASVTEIGDSAFYSCQGLTTMVIPKGVSVISSNTFIGCGLKSIYLPESITEIRAFAFSGCNDLTDVYFGGTEAQWNQIEIDAYENDPLLNAEVHYEVPDFCILEQPADAQAAVGNSAQFSVSAIGSGLTYRWQYLSPSAGEWKNCSSKNVGYNTANLTVEMTEARDHYQYRCVVTDENGSQLTSDTAELRLQSDVRFLSYFVEDGEVTITGFNYEFELPASLVIPDTIEGCPVTAIQRWAFTTCASLESVEIPDTVTTIGEAAFYECKNLRQVRLPAHLTEIPESVFVDCSSLMEVTIPDSVQSIGNDAFYNCSALTEVTIPDSVQSIGYDAFHNCSGLTELEIPANVSDILVGAFAGCTGLTEIRVDPNNPCYRSVDGVLMSKDGTQLLQYPAGRAGSYQVPDGVNLIETAAFSDSTKLTDVTIPAGVRTVGDSVFHGCLLLTDIYVEAENPNYRSEQGVLMNYYGTLLCCPPGKSGEYVVPESVTTIGRYAFSSCINLTDIRLHSGIVSVEEGAFEQCRSLTSMELPEGITSIEYWTFGGCENLQHVTIPKSVNFIDRYAFNGCWSLQSAEIPEGVTGISDVTFYDCRALESVTLPDSLTSIGDSAFDGCIRLKSLTIPGGVTSIGSYAFYGNWELTSVKIPEGVTRIQDYTFFNCGKLTEVWIPAGVSSIGEAAFGECTDLSDVYFAGTEEQWNSIDIGDYNDPLLNAQIHFNSSPFAITAQPQDYVGKLNSTATFTVTAEGDGLKYQWQISDDGENWTNSSVKRAVYTSKLTAEKNGRMVRCIVTDANGKSLTSDSAVMRLAGPVITSQPQDASAAVGVAVAFQVVATGSGLKYQWQISDDGGATWSNSSVKTARYSTRLNAERNGRMVRCIVTDADGISVTSEAAVMSLAGPVITAQPQDYVGKLNSTATFTVTAEGDGLKYQWQISDDGENWTNSSVKRAVYTSKLTAEKNGRMVRCIVTDASGSKVTSAVAAMKLAGPVITAQPQDATAAVGVAVAFQVEATGSGLKYQWQISDDGGATWSNSSVKTARYSTRLNAERNGRMVRCIVTDADGISVTSEAAVMRLPGPVITAQPQDYTGKVNSTASFTVAAEGNGLTYQWQISDDGVNWTNSSVKRAVYTSKLTAAKDGRMVRCVVTDADGNSVTTDSAIMKIG